MSGSAVGLLAFAVLMVAALALEVAARRRGWPASAGGAVAAAMRGSPGRAAVLVAWLWLGVHFLAR